MYFFVIFKVNATILQAASCYNSKQPINVGGYKVNPFEIEECLMDLEEVKEAIVFGKPNSVLGNILCADIVIENDIKTFEIRKHLLKKLQNFKIPRVINYVSQIEKTRTGKKKIK